MNFFMVVNPVRWVWFGLTTVMSRSLDYLSHRLETPAVPAGTGGGILLSAARKLSCRAENKSATPRVSSSTQLLDRRRHARQQIENFQE
jgi:hypothetical protein